jgi:hypothetical protein
MNQSGRNRAVGASASGANGDGGSSANENPLPQFTRGQVQSLLRGKKEYSQYVYSVGPDGHSYRVRVSDCVTLGLA